jgi:hypothetical protein
MKLGFNNLMIHTKQHTDKIEYHIFLKYKKF